MADDMNKTTGIEIPITATDNASSQVDNVSRSLDNLSKRQNLVNQLSNQWSTLYKEIGRVGERLKEFTKEYKARVKSASVNNRSARYGGLFTDETSRLKEQYSGLKAQKSDIYKDIKVNERKLVVEQQTYQLYERMQTLVKQLTDLEIARVNTSNQLKDSLLGQEEYVASQVTKKKQEAQLQREITENLAQDPKYIADRIAKEKASASINKQINAEVKEQKVNYKTLSVRVSNFLGMVRRFTFVGYLVRSVTGLINDFARAGANWTENLNLFEISFGSATEGAIENLITFSDKLGVARNEVIKASADFQTLANSIGISNEISADFSIALTKLGYDIGSLRNLDFEDVFQKLQSTIYGGQVKTARTLGINITATGLEEMLAQLGLADVKFRQLSESQKVMLRAIATFKQLGTEGANVYGDLGNTITSLANRVRVFQASFQNLKLALSSYFESTFSTLVSYATAFVQALTAIVNVNVEQKLSSGFNDTAKSISDANDEANELNDTLGLLNIDKFNVLGKGSVSGGSSGNIDQVLGQSLTDYINQFNQATDVTKAFDKEVTDLKNKIIQWVYPLSQVNEETGEITINTDKLGNVVQGLYDIFSSFKNIITNILKISKAISPYLLKLADSFFSIVASVTTLLDKLHLLEPVLLGIFTLLAGKKLIELGKFFAKPFISLIGYYQQLNMNNNLAITGMDKFRVAVSNVSNAIMAFATVFSILDAFINSLPEGAREVVSVLSIVIGGLVTILGLILAIKGGIKGGLYGALIAGAGLGALVAGIKGVATKSTQIQVKANGGVVEDGLFTMNKHEMFGKFSDGTSVVANNMQIVEGIKAGVYEAVKEALPNNGGQKQTAVFNLNGKEFARATFNDYNYVGKTNTGLSWGGSK